MTWTQFWAAFLGAFGGVTVGVAAIQFLGGKFIEHQLAKALALHKLSLDKQMVELQTGMSRLSDVLSRRNEREFAITEQLWERMVKAVGTAQGKLGSGGRRPFFLTKSEPDAQRLVAGLQFEEEEKEELLAAQPAERDALYVQIDLRHAMRACYEEWAEFKNWLSIKEIFIDGKVLLGLREIRDELHHVIIKYSIYLEVGRDISEMSLDERLAAERVLAIELNRKIDTLALVVRSRFGFE